MYPYFRFLRIYWGTKVDPKFDINKESELKLRVRLQDIDIYPELNNGRYMTLCDLARTHMGLKVGLIQQLRKRKWALVMGGSSGKYRRRILYRHRFTIKTQIIYHDSRWLYFHQTFDREEKIHASFLMRAAVVDKNGFIHPKDIYECLDMDYTPMEIPKWVASWLEAEKWRPATD